MRIGALLDCQGFRRPASCAVHAGRARLLPDVAQRRAARHRAAEGSRCSTGLRTRMDGSHPRASRSCATCRTLRAGSMTLRCAGPPAGEELHLGPPVPRPGKFIAAGPQLPRPPAARASASGRSAARTCSRQRSRPHSPNSRRRSSASGDAIVLPPGIGDVDYEVELVVVIGTRALRVAREDSAAPRRGLHDLQRRGRAQDPARRDGASDRHRARQELSDVRAARTVDDHRRRDPPDPQRLAIGLTVNGEVQASTATRSSRWPSSWRTGRSWGSSRAT